MLHYRWRIRRLFQHAVLMLDHLQETSHGSELQLIPGLHESLPDIYEDLSNLAAWMLRGERKSLTLEASDLVHEAILRLARSSASLSLKNRRQFVRLASENMRRILIEHARKKASLKGGGGLVRVPLEHGEAEDATASVADAEEILAIDDALIKMGQIFPLGAEIIQLRFFAGLTFDEISLQLDMPRTSVFREWTVTRAWLKAYLSSA